MKHPILISLAAVPLLLATSSCGMLNDDPAALVDAALEDNDFAGARVHLARLVADNPQDMQLRLRYADTLLNLGDPIGAQGALEALPANAQGQGLAATLMAHAMLAQGKAQEALAWAGKADQNDAYTAWVRIGALLAAGQESEAFALADTAGKAHAGDARLTALRGEIALSRRQIEPAKRLAQAALEADREDLAANILAGKIALLRQDHAGAEGYFKAAIAANPAIPGPYLSLGAVQADLGKLDEADATLKKANEIAPGHPMGMFLSAKLAFVKGDLEQAHAIMQEAESSLRKVPAAQLLLGEIAHLRGNNEQAIAFLRPFLRDNPGHIHGATVMAQALLATGDSAKAWDMIQMPAQRANATPQLLALGSKLARQTGNEDVFAARMGPANPPADLAQNLARAAQAMKQQEWAKASQIYGQLRKQGMENNALVLNNGALAALNSGNAAQAIDLARRAYALVPEDPQVMDTLGWVLLQAKGGPGDKAEALRLLSRAKEGLPGNLEVRWHYAAALAANGRKDEARRVAATVSEFGDRAQRAHIDALLARL